MAQGILTSLWNKIGQFDLVASSMGIHGIPNQPPTDLAIEVCRENNIDISELRSRPIVNDELKSADLIYTMEPFQQEYIRIFFPSLAQQVFMLAAYPAPDHSKKHTIKDPVGGTIKDYRKSFEELITHIKRIIPLIPNQQ
jgi:protein-tyrosine-phosphatase